MNYVIVVPEPVAAEIASWGLPLETEDELYARLEEGLTQDALDRLWRHPGPGFVFVFDLEFPDPLILGVTHHCTFWLTYGGEPDHLYIQQCEHRQEEDWASGDEPGADGGSV